MVELELSKLNYKTLYINIRTMYYSNVWISTFVNCYTCAIAWTIVFENIKGW